MHVRKVRVDDKVMDELKYAGFRAELDKELHGQGFQYYIDEKSHRQSLDFRGIRLSKSWIGKHGHNVSPYTGRRGSILGWSDWVRFNNTVNKVMDKFGMSANVSSLGGKFKIREGTKAMTEKDWEGLGEENIGSIVSPVKRREAWVSEKEHYEYVAPEGEEE